MAAAGNGEQRCTLPASLTDVIAVGVYDLERHEVPDYARYAPCR